jgi:hypothetical protein
MMLLNLNSRACLDSLALVNFDSVTNLSTGRSAGAVQPLFMTQLRLLDVQPVRMAPAVFKPVAGLGAGLAAVLAALIISVSTGNPLLKLDPSPHFSTLVCIKTTMMVQRIAASCRTGRLLHSGYIIQSYISLIGCCTCLADHPGPEQQQQQ